MTNVLARTACLALAAIDTTATFGAADTLAAQQFAKADVIAVSQMQVLAAQTVVIVGHRNA